MEPVNKTEKDHHFSSNCFKLGEYSDESGYTPALTDHYFLTEPEEFLYTHFPLTTSTVIPVILLIASNQTSFEKSESRGVSRKAGWYLFISLYSIFLLELTLFIRAEVHSDDAALVVPNPLHWTRPGGGILRNMATYIVFSFLL